MMIKDQLLGKKWLLLVLLVAILSSGCVNSAGDSNGDNQEIAPQSPQEVNLQGRDSTAPVLFGMDQLVGAKAGGFSKTIITASISPVAGVPTGQILNDEGNFVLVGSVVNGSGGPLGEINELRLIMTDKDDNEQHIFGYLSAEGQFRFSNVPYHKTWSYLLEMEHNGVTYRSARIYGQNFHANEPIDLSFKVYDASNDLSALEAERLHVLLNFDSNGMIHVIESYLIVNSSSYTIASDKFNTPLISFDLSDDAKNIEFKNMSEGQFLQLTGYTLGDSQPILPGSVHQVLFQYDLPFNGERTIEFSSPILVSSVIMMVQDPKNQVNCSGMKRFEKSPAGSSSIMLFTESDVAAGKPLAISCYNKKDVRQITLGIISIAIILFAVVLILNDSRRKAEKKRLTSFQKLKKATILDAIIALDDQLKAGEISADAYRAKREELIRTLEGE